MFSISFFELYSHAATLLQLLLTKWKYACVLVENPITKANKLTRMICVCVCVLLVYYHTSTLSIYDFVRCLCIHTMYYNNIFDRSLGWRCIALGQFYANIIYHSPRDPSTRSSSSSSSLTRAPISEPKQVSRHDVFWALINKTGR